MNIAVKPDQALPIGPVAFTIPEVLGFPRKSWKNRGAKMIGPRSVKALNPALGETKS